MSSDVHQEFAALRALGLLAQPEQQSFELELKSDAELARLARSLENTVTHLALAAPQRNPPPELKQRILEAVPESCQQPSGGNAMGQFAPWALAAALAVTAAGLAVQNLGLRQENGALQTERRLAEIAFSTAQGQLAERSLLAEGMINQLGANLRHSEDLARLKVSALASLAGNTKEAQAIAVWDPDQQAGLLTIDQLPAIQAEQDYQIWVVDPAYQNPVNGGVFHVSAAGRSALAFRPDQPVRQAAAFAISLEKKGGVPKAEGPILLLGKL